MASISSLSPTRSNIPTSADESAQLGARRNLTQLAQAQAPGNPFAADVARKVDTLVQGRFHGNYREAFDHYAGSDGELSQNEVKSFLRDARIGSDFPIPVVGSTRDAFANGLMDQFDSNHNRSVSWQEFSGGVQRFGVNPND